MTTRPNRLLTLLLVLAGAIVPSAASADQVLQDGVDNNTHAPAIAYNSDADQYLVVYVTSFGRLEGQILDADGTSLDTIVEVLPDTAVTAYREPRLTYRPADGVYVMVAILEVDGLIPTVGVTVTTLDVDGGIVRTDDVPGFVDPTAEMPDVMADTFADCCTLVTWKQSFGSIYGQRFDADGFPEGSRINIYVDGGSTSSRAFNPRIAYQRQPTDDFAVVWQLARNGGLAGQLQARVVEPLSGTLGATQTIATMVAAPWARFGQRFPGGPDIAYDEEGDRYYIAWLDEDGVKLIRSPANLSGGATFNVFTNNPASGYIARGGTPEVTIAEGFGKAYVSHPLQLSGVFGPGRPAHWIHGWWFSATGVFPESPLSEWWFEEAADNVVAAFSPVTETVLGVWERDELSPHAPPPNDLYFELEDVP